MATEDSSVRLPWFWILFGLASIVGARVALKRDHAYDYKGMKALVASGADLESPREIEFLLFVPEEGPTDKIAKALQERGYVTAHERGSYETRTSRWSPVRKLPGSIVSARKVVVLYGATLKDARAEFEQFAAAAGGQYLGWEAVERSASAART